MLQIVCVHDGSTGRLTVDRLTVFEQRAQAKNVPWHISDSLFVGGVPPGKAQRNIPVRVAVDSSIQEGWELKPLRNS